MDKLKYYIKEILIVGLAIALFFSVKTCKSESHLKDSANKQLTAKTEYFKNKLGTTTATIQVLEVDKNTLKNTILKQDDSLKKLASEFAKVKSIVKWKSIYKIDTIRVNFETELPCDFKIFDRYDRKWLSFNYQFDNTGFILDDLTIQNQTTIITGFKRKWFLGKQTLITDITNTNPYFKSTEIKSTTITIPKPFYDTRVFNIGVGLVGGLLIN